MSGGQKHAILKRDFSYLCGVFLHKEVFFKCPLHFSRSLGVIEIYDAEHTSGNQKHEMRITFSADKIQCQ